MLTDKNKGITNTLYNILNLPDAIEMSGNRKVEYTYAADGTKLRKLATENSTVVSDIYYFGGFEYSGDGQLQYIHHEKGRVRYDINGDHKRDYNITDHLGNVRVMFTDDGTGTAEELQVNNYYPYGMRFNEGPTVQTEANNYTYSGKELQQDFGLNWTDHHARFFDPELGRWHVQDPLHQYKNPYLAMGNNPISQVDLDGMRSRRWKNIYNEKIHGRHPSGPDAASGQGQNEAPNNALDVGADGYTWEEWIAVTSPGSGSMDIFTRTHTVFSDKFLAGLAGAGYTTTPYIIGEYDVLIRDVERHPQIFYRGTIQVIGHIISEDPTHGNLASNSTSGPGGNASAMSPYSAQAAEQGSRRPIGNTKSGNGSSKITQQNTISALGTATLAKNALLDAASSGADDPIKGYVNGSKWLGKALGAVGTGLVIIDGTSDGDFSNSDALRTTVSVGTWTIPYAGWMYGLSDFGTGLFGTSLTDRLVNFSERDFSNWNDAMENYDMGLPGACFIAGTKVYVTIDSAKNIEDIAIGDSVLTVNMSSFEIEKQEVLEVVSPYHENLIDVQFMDRTKLSCTTDHPYYVLNKGWCSFEPDLTKINYSIDVRQLELGDVCFKLIENKLVLNRIVDIKVYSDKQRTYNISKLSGNANYFVNGVLIHNEEKW